METINPSSIMLYIIVFCICIMYFRDMNITMGIILGIVVSVCLIYFLYHREITDINNETELHNLKSQNIKPQTKHIQNYRELTDFVFSIQEFHSYNPQAFEQLVQNLDTFIEIYEYVLLDNSLAGDYYSIADMHKLSALNHLHSIIIVIPSDKKIIHKLNSSMEILEKLLNGYLTEIYEKNKKYIGENGYFNNSKIIELNISPYNSYQTETMEQYY